MATPISSLIVSSELVTIRGWVETIRSQKLRHFVILRDGAGQSHRVQVVIPRDICDSLPIESYVQITGTVQTVPEKARTYRGFELQATDLKVLGASDSSVASICPKDAGPGVKLAQRHIYLRDPTFASKTVLRTHLIRAIRKFFTKTSCTEIFPPSFVGTQCEGGATLFKVQYPGVGFDKDVDADDTLGEDETTMGFAYLTQSSQFYLEYALPSLGDVFCIAPSFRKELSHTRRHLTEFMHAESEWSGIFTLEDHIEKLRQLVKGVITVFLKYGEVLLKELDLYERVTGLLEMCDTSIVLTHREAIDYCRAHKIYKDETTETYFDYSDDIPEAQERRIIDEIGKIVYLVRFPTVQKSFYMQEAEDDPTYALGVDVEFPGVGECIGSGVRVHDVDVLRRRLAEQQLDEKDYREYIDLRRFGPGRTSGMGMGVDRFLTWLLGSYSIREVVTFPRYPGRVFP